MGKSTAVVVLFMILVAALIGAAPGTAPIEVYFSPKGGCTDAIVKEIGLAKRELKVQAYSFTSTAIAKAIAEAHDRGVKVAIILDKSQETERYSGATYLVDHQIPTLIDAKHGIAHNKVMVIDGSTVITGSFNFTQAAENSNAENLVVIRDRSVAEKYLANFADHMKHSEPYQKE